MSFRALYWAVLLIVLTAWFSHSTTKPSIDSKAPQGKGKIDLSELIKDPEKLGIEHKTLQIGGNCNIERINGTTMGDHPYPITKDGLLKLDGWAIDTKNARLPKNVLIHIKGAGNMDFYAKSHAGLLREDVRTYFKLSDKLNSSGFEMAASLRDIRPGLYSIAVLAQFEDATYICDNRRKIHVH